MEAAEQLKAWTQVDDADERLRLLTEEAGIMECLLPTRAENFLDEQERRDYQTHFERLVEITTDDEASLEAQIARQHSLWDKLWSLSTPSMLERLVAHLSNPEAEQLKDTLRALYQTGLERAKAQGYTLEGENYYGPWEAEIEQALETYRQCRAYAQRAYHFNPGGEGEVAPFSLQDVLAEVQAFLQQCDTMPPEEAAKACRLAGVYQTIHTEHQGRYSDYLDSILALAALGVATPELALSAPLATPAALAPGVEAFDRYCRLLKETADLQQAVEQKLNEWEAGTAGHSPLPVFLFEQEQQAYHALQQEQDALFQCAKQAVAAMEPGRVLIWHSDIDDDRHALGYRKRRIECLVRRDFPLREFSSPQGEHALSHLSLHQLLPHLPSRERDPLQRALSADGVLPARLWSAPETALSTWLQHRGCEKVEHRRDWHDDALGFFLPARFFDYLTQQGHVIDSLQGASKTAWGQALQKVLFMGPSREQLRLFDASAQAQMLRLVGMARHDLNTPRDTRDRSDNAIIPERQATLTFFDTELTADTSGKGEQKRRDEVALGNTPSGEWAVSGSDPTATQRELTFGWEGKGTFSLARGELPLGRLTLPHPAQARPVMATLTQRNHEERNLGRYVVVLDAVAKGFAGASLALAAKTGLTFNEDGLSISGLDWVKREAETASIEAFAGARLGIETTCTLSWEPPDNLTRLLPGQAARSALWMAPTRKPLHEWRHLGQAMLGGDINAGIGAKLGLMLGMQNGKFVLRVAARLVVGKGVGGSLAFELDVASLNLWLAMLHRAMVDNHYTQPDWIDDDAYENMSWLGYLATTTLLDVGLLAARGQAGIERLFHAFTGGSNAGPIAYEIVNASDRGKGQQLASWVQQLTPAGLGALLYLLSREPKAFKVEGEDFSREQALDFQQIAISNCLAWIVDGVITSVYGPVCRFSSATPTPSQYLYTRAVVRMTATGQPLNNYPDTAYLNHQHHLEQFMQRVSGTGNTAIKDVKADYRLNASRLGVLGCATNE